MSWIKRTALLTSIVSILCAYPARAEVKCASVFGDHMVLQREVTVPFWGTADAGEDVTVHVGNQTKSTKADDKGKWLVKLDPIPLGTPIEVQVSGKNTIKFTDVLIGDVWICSGQSNMGFHLKQTDRADEEIAAAKYPNIRLFDVKHATAPKPIDSVSGKWEACTPESAPSFSAVGYFFGRYVHEKVGLPVGLIHTSWGGTPAEAWTDEATLRAGPDFAEILKRAENYPTEYPKLLEKYEAAAAKAKALPAGAKQPVLRKPSVPGANPYLASVLYNAMIAPLQPYAIKGAIWYQGEANAGRAAQYRKLLPAMIGDWRKNWGQGDFPFLIVQLANFSANNPNGTSPWAELREAQMLTAHQLPNCGIATTIDIGNPTNVHPTNKQEVGKRLGLVAEKLVYGHDVEDSGPVYSSMTVEGSKVRVLFSHAASGLQTHGDKLEGFSIAGEDQKFVVADAAIDSVSSPGQSQETVTLSSSQVVHPIAVRYGWANSPTCTLYNKAGLPAFPFRTDDWTMVTATAR